MHDASSLLPLFTGNRIVIEQRFQPIADREKKRGDSVTDELRRSIIMRRLKLGERLVERKVADELNVSITPLRQAFQVLANEGLIKVIPYTGSYVTTITPEFIEDVRFCRNIVEPAAAGQAYDALVARDPECLSRLLEETIKEYKRTGQLFDLINRDIQFHETIIIAAQRRMLLEFWRMLSPRIMLLLSYAKRQSFSIQQFHDRHCHIAGALASKAGAEAFADSLRSKLKIAYCPKELDIMLTESAYYPRDGQ